MFLIPNCILSDAIIFFWVGWVIGKFDIVWKCLQRNCFWKLLEGCYVFAIESKKPKWVNKINNLPNIDQQKKIRNGSFHKDSWLNNKKMWMYKIGHLSCILEFWFVIYFVTFDSYKAFVLIIILFIYEISKKHASEKPANYW